MEETEQLRPVVAAATHDDIPNEAVEAAAWALAGAEPWQDIAAVWLRQARRALAAALPVLRAQVERDIRQQDGVGLIAAERRRQVEVEGYTPEHDSLHNDDSLACAAAVYALPARSRDYQRLLDGSGSVPKHWPWSKEAWKPTRREWTSDRDEGYWDAEAIRCRVRDLTKAGALIAAEIDRLLAARVARGSS